MPRVTPEWFDDLPMQQQSVMLLGARGPDTVGKFHPCKDVVRAYRATVFKAAYFGRELMWGERADSFMSLDIIADSQHWGNVVNNFFDTVDEVPHHYYLHLVHGTEIIGYKHPDHKYRVAWSDFYLRACDNLHMKPESIFDMDKRLGDWGRRYWEYAA